MITGATRGTGFSGALARHLLKAENDAVVIPARGLGSTTLAEQIAELVAMSAGGRTDRPVYHVFCSPDPAIADDPAARARFWALFETEFDMTAQPYCGVEHDKDGRHHEHRVYSLVRPSGFVANLSWDYARREKCARIVEFEFGMPAVPSKFALSIANRLRREGRHNVAAWLVASGTMKSERPIARLTPRERLIEKRTGIALDDIRRAALAAWRESTDGPGFLVALQVRGLDMRQGRVGPVILDGTGTAHLATRLIGAAARRVDGERIPASTVKARLVGMDLEGVGNGRSGNLAAPLRAGAAAPYIVGGAYAGAGTGRLDLRRSGGSLVGPDGGGRGRDACRPSPALQRLRAAPAGRGILLRRRLTAISTSDARYLTAAERARKAVERMDEKVYAERSRAWALWGMTDIWGIPLQ